MSFNRSTLGYNKFLKQVNKSVSNNAETLRLLKAYGGNSFAVRIYRTYFEARTSLADMWKGNPVLTTVLFGLPLGFLSLILYSICCSDILDAEDDEEEGKGFLR